MDYRQQSTTDEIKSAVCPECESTIHVVQGGKESCGDCGYEYGPVFSRYGAKKATHNGKRLGSKYEAGVAIDLETKKAAGAILDYDTQYKVIMPIYRGDGKVVGYVNHKVDFRQHNLDGSFTLLEAKGKEGFDYVWRRTLLTDVWLPEHKDHDYKVIKQGTRR